MFDMKNKRHLLEEGVFDAFAAMSRKGATADRALQFIMRKYRYWSDAERAWVAHTFYDIVRYWRLLATVAGTGTNTDKSSLWHIFGVWLLRKGQPLPEEKEFARLNQKQVMQRLEKFKKVRALQQSIPDWLDQRGEKELGERWEPLLRALNERPPLMLRVNTLLADVNKVLSRLAAENFQAAPVEGSDTAIEMKGGNVFRSKAFEDGWFEVQDLSSQEVAPFLDVQPGLRVVDACAGAGGKSLHLAALMKNKGRLLALDTVPEKLEELKRRARRAGAGVIETRAIDSSKVTKRLQDSADRLLLDLPCSGTGVLRRNPDIRWRLSEEDLERLLGQQRDMLDRYSAIVKPGGKLVYAVCSVLPAEGEMQVSAFLQRTNGAWTLEEERRTGLLEHKGDGFYMARLLRVS